MRFEDFYENMDKMLYKRSELFEYFPGDKYFVVMRNDMDKVDFYMKLIYRITKKYGQLIDLDLKQNRIYSDFKKLGYFSFKKSFTLVKNKITLAKNFNEYKVSDTEALTYSRQ